MKDLKLQKRLFGILRETVSSYTEKSKDFDSEFGNMLDDLVVVLASTVVAGSIASDVDREKFDLLLHKTATMLKSTGHLLYNKVTEEVSVDREEN